jgi:hypothetical protein
MKNLPQIDSIDNNSEILREYERLNLTEKVKNKGEITYLNVLVMENPKIYEDCHFRNRRLFKGDSQTTGIMYDWILERLMDGHSKDIDPNTGEKLSQVYPPKRGKCRGYRGPPYPEQCVACPVGLSTYKMEIAMEAVLPSPKIPTLTPHLRKVFFEEEKRAEVLNDIEKWERFEDYMNDIYNGLLQKGLLKEIEEPFINRFYFDKEKNSCNVILLCELGNGHKKTFSFTMFASSAPEEELKRGKSGEYVFAARLTDKETGRITDIIPFDYKKPESSRPSFAATKLVDELEKLMKEAVI